MSFIRNYFVMTPQKNGLTSPQKDEHPMSCGVIKFDFKAA
jgi:hypothetical protein